MKNDAGTKAIKALIRKWNTVKNELPTLLGNEAVNHFKNNFRLQGFEDSGVQAWKPRKKSDTGRATLVKSGNLRRSIRIAYATWAKTSIISDLPYSAIHNYGGNGKAWGKHPFRMEQRKYMGMSHTLNKKSLMLIRKRLRRVF